jgi:hypothetical protein
MSLACFYKTILTIKLQARRLSSFIRWKPERQKAVFVVDDDQWNPKLSIEIFKLYALFISFSGVDESLSARSDESLIGVEILLLPLIS